MSLETLRAGGPACPSDLLLDRLVAGELPKEKSLAATEHARGCAGCSARLAMRKQGFDAFDGLDERRLLAGIRRGLDENKPVRRPGGALLAALAALAAVAAAVALVPRPAGRLKGGLSLHVFLLRGGAAVEALSGDRFQPGERLRFVVDLPAEGEVRVLGVEQRGVQYTAWPLDRNITTRLGPGAAIPLPGAVQLDTSGGRETLYLVQCPEAPSCPNDSGGRPACPSSCSKTSFVLDKGL